MKMIYANKNANIVLVEHPFRDESRRGGGDGVQKSYL